MTSLRCLGSSLFAILLLSVSAHAVVVRGVVTDPLGRPLAGAQVRLIHGQQVAGVDTAGVDGAYEIRSALSGRFVLLTVSARFVPQIGRDFYGGRTAVVTRNIAVDRSSIQPVESVMADGIATPLEQVTGSVSFVPEDALRTRLGIADELALSPGIVTVQTDESAKLLLRGGDSYTARIDGIPAENIGGGFDLGTVSTLALAGGEVYRGANSALVGSDAEAGVGMLASRRGKSLRPLFEYTGDAGNLHTWHDEAIISGTYAPVDYLAGYTRVDSSNALPLDRYHQSSAVANLGYNVLTNTQVRFTLRNGDSASGMTGPHDILGVSRAGRHASQGTYSGLSVDNSLGKSHTAIRFGISRKRTQEFDYLPQGQPIFNNGVTTYYGDTITLQGANGYRASGRAAVNYSGSYPAREDVADDRDELSLDSDYEFTRHFTALLGLRYENERGEFVDPSASRDRQEQRTNFNYTLQLRGDIVNRLFYSAGGTVEKNHLLGMEGSPRIGLAYIPVLPGTRWLRGTKVHGDAATGFSEPGLNDEANSIYEILRQSGNILAMQQYRLTPLTARRSRTFEIGVDQNLRGQKLIFRSTYFHNQFSHQTESLDSGTLKQLFGIPMTNLEPYATDGSLAFRAQGIETEVQYQPRPRLYVHGGYTYLSAVVERSFSAGSVTNPNLPGIAIGPSYPLVGARPFQRPPHSGFFAAQHTGDAWTAAFEATLASRSDDSTFQTANDASGGNTLLLPNRDLDFGYAKLDANLTARISTHVTVFTQLDNLLDRRHIGPIGYPGLPFAVRAGLKVRIGGE
jgi:vitamin B12 transporter